MVQAQRLERVQAGVGQPLDAYLATSEQRRGVAAASAAALALEHVPCMESVRSVLDCDAWCRSNTGRSGTLHHKRHAGVG